jgi:SPP1 family predicted phage head-tail adaptor
LALNSDVIISNTNFRYKVKLATPNLTRGPAGGVRSDDATVIPGGEVWAAVEAISMSTFGKKVYAAQQETSEVTHLVTIRYLDGVKSNMLVWFRTRQFHIEAIVDPDEQQKVLFLLCIERNDSALEVPSA